MKSQTETIEIPKKELDVLNKMLESQEEIRDEPDVIETYTARFTDGYEADIKVCNGDGPYVDAVLFLDGSEVCVLEASDQVDGIYQFHHMNRSFCVIVNEKAN
jgi:hypothetical protein